MKITVITAFQMEYHALIRVKVDTSDIDRIIETSVKKEPNIRGAWTLRSSDDGYTKIFLEAKYSTIETFVAALSEHKEVEHIKEISANMAPFDFCATFSKLHPLHFKNLTARFCPDTI